MVSIKHTKSQVEKQTFYCNSELEVELQLELSLEL